MLFPAGNPLHQQNGLTQSHLALCPPPHHPSSTPCCGPCAAAALVLWQVETLLAGSGLRQKAATIISAADLLWQDLQPITTAANQRGLCPPDMFSRADIDWAVGICLSRSVRLDDRKGEVVLVPYADLLNHDTSCEAYLVWDEQQQSVVLRPDRSYKAGEQVRFSTCCPRLPPLHCPMPISV